MENTLLQQGVDLLLYGMGSVLVFLTLLVLATLAMSAVMMRFFREPELPLPDDNTRAAAPGAAVDKRTLAIVQAAIDQHRKKRRK